MTRQVSALLDNRLALTNTVDSAQPVVEKAIYKTYLILLVSAPSRSAISRSAIFLFSRARQKRKMRQNMTAAAAMTVLVAKAILYLGEYFLSYR